MQPLSVGAGYFTPVAYPGIFFRAGGSTNSAEDSGQREGGSGGSSPLVRGFTQFVIERNPYIPIRLLQIIFHGTGNLARLFQYFGIFFFFLGGGCFKPPKTTPLGTPVVPPAQ
jgi:hypothetical protein